MTNDLNMLLKAQTLGIPVQRHGDGVEGGFIRRYVIRPFQRYRTPIMILALRSQCSLQWSCWWSLRATTAVDVLAAPRSHAARVQERAHEFAAVGV